MATIITREVGTTAKGSPLTNAEIDNNFINLNAAKVELVNGTIPSLDLDVFVAWDSSADSYVRYAAGETQLHRAMRRCLLLDNGTVNYYLDNTNSNRRATGEASDLTGASGQVMVEIPKFYTRRVKVGNVTTWYISDTLLPGYTVHPAFIKNGVEVNYRYYGAYDACVYDASAAQYISGLNLDDASALVDTAADKLSSVSAQYPIVGLTRAQCRALAKNRGTGWRLLDYWLVQAVELLYLVEYQNFNTQLVLGAGNTAGSYLPISSTQTDSPHTISGASNLLGNTSTNGITGVATNTKPGTSYVNYRGIENWFGNCWNWVDGYNILNYQSWVSNTDTAFADDTSTGYTSLGSALPTSNGWVSNIQAIDNAFLPSAATGSSTTYICDYYYTASGNRVALFGGAASAGAFAGGFCWLLNGASSGHGRDVGARLAF